MESLAIEFCAFTVAIAVELHPWTEVDTRKQWNPEQLSLEIGAGPCGDSVNLTVDTEALHQGLYIFKRALNNFRHEIVQMGGNKSVMSISSFMELPERRKGLNIIFVWLQRSETATYEEILQKICNTANNLLLGCGYQKTRFRSLGELCGFLWQEKERAHKVFLNTPDTTGDPPATVNKRRKSADQLGPKMLTIYGKQILDYVSNNLSLGEDDPDELYLAAALKESKKRPSLLDSVAMNIFPTDGIDDESYLRVMGDQRVIDSIKLYPKRNITFTSVEKDLVICLLDIIKSVIIEIEGLNTAQLDYRAAEMTKEALSNHPVYSELVTSSIVRWDSTRDIVLQTRGRKVYKEFEAEVWGKLMLYEFENVMVRDLNIFIFDYNSSYSYDYINFLFK